jgi:hypothetical protein
MEEGMTDSLRELLPCPFCGETAFGTVGSVVGCSSCDIWMTSKAWNRRALLAETPPSDQGLRKQIRSGIWSMAEWAFSEGQRGSNWGDYTGAAASERMEKIIYAIFASKKGGEE